LQINKLIQEIETTTDKCIPVMGESLLNLYIDKMPAEILTHTHTHVVYGVFLTAFKKRPLLKLEFFLKRLEFENGLI